MTMASYGAAEGGTEIHFEPTVARALGLRLRRAATAPVSPETNNACLRLRTRTVPEAGKVVMVRSAEVAEEIPEMVDVDPAKVETS